MVAGDAKAAGAASVAAEAPTLSKEEPTASPGGHGHGAPTDQDMSLSGLVGRTTLGGYAEFIFENEEDKNSRFASLRFVMALHSKLSERLTAIAEVELERGGSPEKRNGELVVGEALLEQALIDFEIFEWLVARAGVLLVPFGNYNQRHDAPQQELVDRPISDLFIIPSTWFEAGAGIWGDWDFAGTHHIHYEAYFINGFDAKLSDQLGTRAARGSLSEDNNNDKAIVSQVRYSPHPVIDAGFSFYTGDYDLSDNRIWMFGGDMLFSLSQFEAVFSYAKLFADEGFVEGFAEGSPANTRNPVPTGMNGLFGEVRYRIPLRVIMPDDLQGATMVVAARYAQIDMDEDVTSSGDRADLVAGLNFRPILPTAFKAELHLLRNGSDGQAPGIFEGFFKERATLRFVASAAYGF